MSASSIHTQQGVTINSREESSNSRGSRAQSSGGRGYENETAVNPSKNSSDQQQQAIAGSNYFPEPLNFSTKIAKWTRKVQQGISCGGGGGAPFSSNSSSASPPLVRPHDPPASHNNNNIPVRSSNMDRLMPEKPPRSKAPPGHYHGKRMGESSSQQQPQHHEWDHHTLATATTASATTSYSTDQGDASDVSEAGMEVIMAKNSSEEENMLIVRKSSREPYVSHSFPAGKNTFTVDVRYSMLRVIGSGAYGVVISSKDRSTDENVAIKMVPKAFSDEIDAKRILREIKLLNHFKHDNIVRLIDMMPPNVKFLDDFIDVYLVTDLMETDLHRIIYSKQKLTIDHVQYFVYQVLRGLKYIHSCGVLHRDLKPSNLLVNSNCDLKICDFGLARGIERSNDEGKNETMLLTEYVVTRWYRAPEIMLACHEYSYPIDVWSVGCIFAELILRKPYFPGDDYIDQVSDNMRVGGTICALQTDFGFSTIVFFLVCSSPSSAKSSANYQSLILNL